MWGNKHGDSFTPQARGGFEEKGRAHGLRLPHIGVEDSRMAEGVVWDDAGLSGVR